MQTEVTELEESRVRVDVEVDPASVDKRIDRAAKSLGRELRMPGFRKGKVPPSLVLQRVGRAAVLQQAVEESMPEWYGEAVRESGIVPIGEPELSLGDVPEETGPLTFSIEIGVRPVATLGEYKGLEVGKAEAEADPEQVDAELERMRETLASLEEVAREAAEGDFVIIDYRGELDGEAFAGGEDSDRLLELGSNTFIPGFEQQLVGSKAGDEPTVSVTFPEDYRATELAGQEVQFAVTVKAVNEKALPELDDDFALEASEFDTIAEVRADIEERLRSEAQERIEGEFRQAAVDVAVAKATIEIPEAIAVARAQDRWSRVEHSLSHRGMNPEQYLAMTGQTREEVVEQARPEAEQDLKREALLAAVAEDAEIDVSKDDMLEALSSSAESEGTTPKKLLERLRSNGREADLREDLRLAKAAELIAESATPVELEEPETPDPGTPDDADGGSEEPGETASDDD
ncbi:MAG: trigger factor [Solirubrobacterales bacterium]